jgi:LPXTG-motif cell wall-anchored protein
VTFTANKSGRVIYSVTRAGTDLISFAALVITLLGGDDSDGEDDSDGDDSDGDDEDTGGADDRSHDRAAAALPNTGASDNLQLIAASGVTSVLLGLLLVAATPRRRGGAHRA